MLKRLPKRERKCSGESENRMNHEQGSRRSSPRTVATIYETKEKSRVVEL
jgi:hypothetical protein